ncbi:MAG: hypothetical protein ACRDJH_07570 [Thermomicrobiales bacterium]
MSSPSRVMNIEDAPELEQIVREIRGTWTELVIRQNGVDVALVVPIEPRVSQTVSRVITEADIEATMSAAGGWADVDTDRLLRDIYADRDSGDRPPVEW